MLLIYLFWMGSISSCSLSWSLSICRAYSHHGNCLYFEISSGWYSSTWQDGGTLMNCLQLFRLLISHHITYWILKFLFSLFYHWIRLRNCLTLSVQWFQCWHSNNIWWDSHRIIARLSIRYRNLARVANPWGTFGWYMIF